MDSGKQIGDYEILGELGQGGMGRVYRVRNVISDRIEAMKVLLPDLAGRQDLAARFLREIKVLAALNHPNIAALRTALTSGNQLVMVMEYVEGQSLAERLAHGPIAPADAVSYIDQVLDALTYAHGRGVVHRDIKPANMMLTASGVVKLTDFGIARSATDETITTAGTTTGSLSYMSPEQVSGEATDARSDLYSVGISLYEMVTGQRPFRADNDFHVMLAHLKEEPRPPLTLQPTLPPALNAIIMRAIAKSPDARFQSAHEFRHVLGHVFASGSTTTADGQTTVLISTSGGTAAVEDLGGPTRGASDTPAGAPSDRARAVPDTQTPPEAPPAIPAAAPGSAPIPPPVVRRSGHPLLLVALGAVLVIAALVGAGLYLVEPKRARIGRPRGRCRPTRQPSPAPMRTRSPPTNGSRRRWARGGHALRAAGPTSAVCNTVGGSAAAGIGACARRSSAAAEGDGGDATGFRVWIGGRAGARPRRRPSLRLRAPRDRSQPARPHRPHWHRRNRHSQPRPTRRSSTRSRRSSIGSPHALPRSRAVSRG
jgi:serine/threonine protein kinase